MKTIKRGLVGLWPLVVMAAVMLLLGFGNALGADVVPPVTETIEAPTIAPATPEPAKNSGIWVMVITAGVPLLIAGLKLLVPRIPKVFLPISAPLLGVAAEWMLNKAGANAPPGWGVFLGLAGTGIRQIVDGMRKATGTAS